MVQLYIRRREVIYQPVDRTATETVPVFRVRAGQRILGCQVTPLVNSSGTTNSTFEMGDGNDTDGFVTSATIDLETATVGTWIDGIGAYLLQTTAGKSKYGFLYLVADTIDVTYTANTYGTVTPKVRIAIDYVPAL